MRLKDLAKQLANRINQEHYVLHYLNKVATYFYKKGKEETEKQFAISVVMQWVAVEDKLPKEFEWVLAYDAIGKQVRYMRRIDDLEWQMGMFSIKDVTHWMPLPKPPCA